MRNHTTYAGIVGSKNAGDVGVAGLPGSRIRSIGDDNANPHGWLGPALGTLCMTTDADLIIAELVLSNPGPGGPRATNSYCRLT